MEDLLYRLAINGDEIERRYWGLFIKDYFPTYELFWRKFVVPLTNRPTDIHFKDDIELSKIGKTTKDLHIAQLNYSIIIHLGRCFDIISALKNNNDIFKQRDLFLEGFMRLIGAQDNAFELLERKINPIYDAFGRKCSIDARNNWLKKEKGLMHIRRYRNSLIHNGLQVAIYDNLANDKIWFAKIDTQDKYCDWRVITDESGPNKDRREKSKEDFIDPVVIIKQAFKETTDYLEEKFNELIKQ